MSRSELEITPSLTIHSLLENFPELEEVLIGIAPPFKKLKNPILRNTVAKVATIKQAAAVGKVPLNVLISTLREAVGQPLSDQSYQDEEYFTEQPDWFSVDKISASIDESKLENKDQMPLVPVLKKAGNLKEGEIIELVTSFLPAPGIDVMKSKGYSVWVKKEREDLIRSYFLKLSH